MIYLLALLATTAHANEWEADVRAQTGIGLGMKDVSGPLDVEPQPTPWSPEAGFAGAVSRELFPKLRLEGNLSLGYILDGGLYVAVRPMLRLYVDKRDETGALSFLAGPGLRIANGVGPDLTVGAALDLRGIPPWMAPRMQALASLGLPGEPAVLELSLGVFFPSPHDAEPVVIEEIVPREMQEVTVFRPVEAMVWMPHPICRWAPADAAHDLLADTINEVEGDLPDLEVRADGFTREFVNHSEDVAEVELKPHPPTGGVVVYSHPGDELIVGKKVVPMSDEGIAVLTVPARKIEVTVFGGGREEKRVVHIEDDQAVWLEFDPAPAMAIAFNEASFALGEESDEVIQGIARRPGSYTYEIKAIHSAEATNKQVKVADRRAKAVADQLKALGIPKSHIDVVQHAEGDEHLVHITPVGGGGE